MKTLIFLQEQINTSKMAEMQNGIASLQIWRSWNKKLCLILCLLSTDHYYRFPIDNLLKAPPLHLTQLCPSTPTIRPFLFSLRKSSTRQHFQEDHNTTQHTYTHSEWNAVRKTSLSYIRVTGRRTCSMRGCERVKIK